MSGRKWGRRVADVEHVGLVLTGSAAVAFDDGGIVEMQAGKLFYIPPVPHDSWVIGKEEYVSLHFLRRGSLRQMTGR